MWHMVTVCLRLVPAPLRTVELRTVVLRMVVLRMVLLVLRRSYSAVALCS